MLFNKRNEQMQLPQAVKEVLQKPQDERTWGNLERLRHAVLATVEGARDVHLCESTVVGQVERSIVDNVVGGHAGIIGADVRDPHNPDVVLVPAGARVATKLPGVSSLSRARRRHAYAKWVRDAAGEAASTPVRLFMYPAGTELAMPLSDEGKALSTDQPLQALARQWKPRLEEEDELMREALNTLMLVLHDALMFSMSARWTSLGVANLQHERTFLMAQCFMRGQAVGRRSLHDGMCARCGALLHGDLGQSSALSNKHLGPPMDAAGASLLHADGAVDTAAQPPFLLMYSPSLFAREIPAAFEHDADTNKLRLRDGVHEPWVRPSHGRFKGKRNTWLYCSECHERYCKGRGSKSRRHLPHRDKASQAQLKPEEGSGVLPGRVQPWEDVTEAGSSCCVQGGLPVGQEAGRLHEIADCDFEADVEDDEPLAADEPEEPQSIPLQSLPSIEEYRAKWAAEQGKHIKPVPGDFSRENLVSEPDAQLMRDVPWVPFP